MVPWPPWRSTWWTGPDHRRRVLLAVAGGVGVLAQLWLVAEGAAGRVPWAVDATATADPLYRAWRLARRLPSHELVDLGPTWPGWSPWALGRPPPSGSTAPPPLP